MAPKAASQHVYIVTKAEGDDGLYKILQVHGNKESADAAAKALDSDDVDVKEFALTNDASETTKLKGKGEKVPARPKAKASKAKEPEPEEGDDDDIVDDDDVDDDAEEEAPKSKKAASKKAAPPKKAAASSSTSEKKTIPEGKPNALKGLKVLFTGTFDAMDRKTSEATATKYGATVIKKLEETDYIILGTRAGQKKLDEIEDKGLETIDEDGFFEILKNGVPKEKRDRMAAKTAAETDEPPKKKAKK